MTSVEAFSDHSSKWGEGPVWWNSQLWWVDIGGKRLNTLAEKMGEPDYWDVGQQIGFAVPAENGTWIWGGEGGVYSLNLDTGESTLRVDPEPDLPRNRFNDAGVSPDGRLFAGTIAMDRTEGAATLYRLEKNLSCTPVVPNVTNSNGIGWSPDGGTMFYIDTPTREVTTYTYEEGRISGRRVLVNTDPLIDASPDGLCVDAEGHPWVAFCHGGCVIQFDHESGAVLQRIDVPAKETTSCCFGGPELRDLFITTGQGKGEKESDGRVYVVKDLPIPGQAQVALEL